MNKITYNIVFLLFSLATIALAYDLKPSGVGTGIIVIFMLLGYFTESSPRD